MLNSHFGYGSKLELDNIGRLLLLTEFSFHIFSTTASTWLPTTLFQLLLRHDGLFFSAIYYLSAPTHFIWSQYAPALWWERLKQFHWSSLFLSFSEARRLHLRTGAFYAPLKRLSIDSQNFIRAKIHSVIQSFNPNNAIQPQKFLFFIAIAQQAFTKSIFESIERTRFISKNFRLHEKNTIVTTSYHYRKLIKRTLAYE